MRLNEARDRDWARVRKTANRAAVLLPDEERSLLARSADDARARARLVDTQMRLVVRIAQSYARHGVAVEDLVSEGVLGLLEAIGRFDPQADTRLSTYAKWWIRARVRAYALRNRRLVALPGTRSARLALAKLSQTERRLTQELGHPPRRHEVAEVIGISLEELESLLLALPVRDLCVFGDDGERCLPADEEELGPERAVADAQQRAQLEELLHRTRETLTWRQRRVLDAQLADDDETTFKALSVELGVTRQRVSQIALSVRERLRMNLQPFVTA